MSMSTTVRRFLIETKLDLIDILTQTPKAPKLPPNYPSYYGLSLDKFPLGDDEAATKFLSQIYAINGPFKISLLAMNEGRNVILGCKKADTKTLFAVLWVHKEAAQTFLRKHAPNATFLPDQPQPPQSPLAPLPTAKPNLAPDLGTDNPHLEPVGLGDDLCLDVADWDLVEGDEEWVVL